MNKTKILIIFIILNLSDRILCQNDSIHNDCGTIIIIDGKSINDSINPPIFDKGNTYLLSNLSKYLIFTDRINCKNKEFSYIDFWIEIDKTGKIIQSKISDLGATTNKFKNDFSKLIADIDFWSPATLKENNKIAVTYNISFTIEIHKTIIVIKLLNDDIKIIYEYKLYRPLKKNG
jgi:hypothetical protein